MENYLKKISSFTLNIIIGGILLSSYAFAKTGDTRIWLQGSTGSGDVKLNNTSYSVDTGGSTLSGIFYADQIYFEAGIGSSDLTLSGVTITSDMTMVGFGFVSGRTDYITGSGEESRFGINIIDMELTLGSYTSSATVTEIGYGSSFGLGDGVTFGFGFSTDFDDPFTDNTYGASFTKSYGEALFKIGLTYNTYVTDARNSGNSTVLTLGIGTQF